MIQTRISCLRQKLKIRPTELFPKHHYSTFSQDQKLISLLNSCADAREISQIHGLMVKTGLDRIPFTLSKLLASAIVDIDYAASIFKHVQDPNLFMFTTMLRGFSGSEDPKQALSLFNHVRTLGIVLDQFCFITTLKACARLLVIHCGRGIHGLILRSGHGLFINVMNTLLSLYCLCGSIRDAHQLFDECPQKIDLVSWSTLLGGYLHVAQPTMVIELFRQMGRSGLEFGISTILTVLSAAGESGNHTGGECIHGYCIKIGFCSDVSLSTALISMYAKTRRVDLGRRVFDGAPRRDVISWNCLIDGYAKSGQLEESLALLWLMKIEQVKPNSSTLAQLLSSCAASGAASVGQCIYDYVEEEQVVMDAVLGTALVDMYCKCGFLDEAIEVFYKMGTKDVKSWTAMISGYGVHGHAKNAVELFYKMEEEGFIPNEITFLTVLNACSHGGLVVEAMNCYERMVKKYGFSPGVEHYGCMIDLLGRAGLIEEAYKLIKRLPTKSDTTAWRALLAACRVHGNVDLGERVRRELIGTHNEHPTDSLLLTSTYAIAGRLPDHTKMQEMKEEKTMEVDHWSIENRKDKMSKEPGCSIIEMDSERWEDLSTVRGLVN
ncbi:pentatricopeptide repeat-containing protein At1g26900, mitochondrial [Malania oleifera]|uniref:pentatricopeptide repeat-containing protein At1g26900, mitochondrial n=1 Tax=Malania oleifera TaxID=397392 RepID=UPI0025AE05E4|nr:pentatricopeptide repeat-containing protein At1g26900, mitochondrial [Malania oleifera]XP_057949977.1 pentatricopeptide repeat-containing protein At1g26900, mitochondrial [Malania oleifera]XP_057949978.1 pentatricopeptide repeat-containing protein At1g26900, mitochondrial [Malania oleifera]